MQPWQACWVPPCIFKHMYMQSRWIQSVWPGVQVRAVRLRRDRIAVALEHKVLLYNFADLRLLNSIETLSNQGGLLALSAEASNTVLACPGLNQGEVRFATDRARA